jgi:hypothetical protein
MGYIYLASPYSAPTLQERVNRFMAAQDRVIALIREGFPVYSPIVHWHHIAEIEQFPKDFGFWKDQNDALLDGADTIEVLAIPGFRTSHGLAYELERARKADKECQVAVPITTGYYVHDLDLHNWTPENVQLADWSVK